MPDELARSLAAAVQAARLDAGLSVAALADASGVSRAMISKIEHAESQPTATLLARLAASLGLTLSELIARAEEAPGRVSRHDAQPVWTDPATGYRRRSVSPPSAGIIEVVEVELPAGARVPAPAESYALIDQQIWILGGHLRFLEGDQVHELDAGDCLQLGSPSDCEFVNPTDAPVRYAVVLAKRVGRR